MQTSIQTLLHVSNGELLTALTFQVQRQTDSEKERLTEFSLTLLILIAFI